MAYRPGDRVGDYEIVDVLGAGGMGKVYKVRNLISERYEAMKVLLPNLEGDPELADRFVREIKVQASLQHPNIAGLHTALRIDNQLLMMLEFLEGTTLEAELRLGRIPVDKAVGYIKQVLNALAYAHERGVVHRDIKPANMMLTPGGVVKLMDFGIARIAADQKLTQTGRTVGSLYYMSPEQINGTELDARSDLYSLGISLYELVTKARPFQGDSDYSIMAAHLQGRPVAPIELDPTLPPALNDIILMSIAKDPAQRFQSATAFAAALNSIPVSSAPGYTPDAVTARAGMRAGEAPPAAVETRAGRSRRGLYMALGSVATLGVLVLAALQGPALWKTSQASSEQAVAETQPAAPAQPASVEPGPAPPTPAQRAKADDPAPRSSTIAARPDTGVTPAPRPEKPSPRSRPTEPPAEPAPPPANVDQRPATGYAPAPQQAHSPAPVPDAAAEAAVREMRTLLNLLDTRANAARASIRTLREQQRAAGYGLRGDIEAAEQQMVYFLAESEAALQSGDADQAKRQLQSAERTLDRIEKFLGR